MIKVVIEYNSKKIIAIDALKIINNCCSLYLVMDCWWLCSFNCSFAHTRLGLLLTHRLPPLIFPYVYSSLHSSIATQ